MSRTCLALQHLSFEDLGTLEPVLRQAGFHIHYRQAGVDDLSTERAAKEWAEADLVVVLGGPIGVYEADRYPFISDELALVKARLQAQRPMVGICLGAQMMAAASGERVYPGPAKEIGWEPLIPTDAGASSVLQALGSAQWQVLHWHGDTFDLPDGATLLASTRRVKNQVFSIGQHALGLQCHLEVDGKQIERWLIGHTGELSAAGVDLQQLRHDTRQWGEQLRDAAQTVFLAWLTQAGLV
ncbi:glutamine amidotransferase [Aquabacterium sp.]|uniref:glutamine amidotransferase n=1 Tax=Aquabacterium sp. TaxID=1872578 RepID=UPI0035ADA083